MKYLREIRNLVGYAGYYADSRSPIRMETRWRWVVQDLQAAANFRRWALEDAGTPDMDPKL